MRGQDYVRLGVLVLAVLVLSWMGWDLATKILRRQPLGIDFLPMWAGAREAFANPPKVYDFYGLTRFQHPLLGHFRGLRPFVYPPTALLAFEPFALAPFPLANALWTGGSLTLIVWTMASRLTSLRWIVLLAMVLSPASVLVLITGQVTFLIASLSVCGLAMVKSRPWLAGVLFGLAGSLKPQSMVLLPVAMIALGQWRVLVAAGAAFAAACLVSAAVFGLGEWRAWLAAVPRFERYVLAEPGLARGMVTPTGLGMSLGLPADALTVWRYAFAGVGVWIAWKVFRTSSDPVRQLTALLGGGLFVSPYAMHYDAALLAPAAALWLTTRPKAGGWILALGASALLCCAAIPHWGAAGVTAFTLLAALGAESWRPDAVWRAVTSPFAALPGRTSPGPPPSGVSAARPLFLLTDRGQDRPAP
jgi:hypothetical protein